MTRPPTMGRQPPTALLRPDKRAFTLRTRGPARSGSAGSRQASRLSLHPELSRHSLVWNGGIGDAVSDPAEPVGGLFGRALTYLRN